MTILGGLDIALDGSNGLIDGFGDVLDVLRVQTADVDSAVRQQEHLVLLH